MRAAYPTPAWTTAPCRNSAAAPSTPIGTAPHSTIPGVPGAVATQNISIASNRQANTRTGVEPADTSTGTSPQRTALIATLVISQGSQRRTASLNDAACSMARQTAAWLKVLADTRRPQIAQV